MEEQQKDQIREYLLLTNALLDSMNASILADSANVWKYAGYKQYMRKYNQLVELISRTTKIETIVDVYDTDKIPGFADTIALQQKDLFESVHANLSVLKAYLGNKLNLKSDEITNIKNFFQANLRKAVFRTPEKEIDIQDAVEQLLIGRSLTKGVDYDRETGRVKYSVKEAVPDFIFPKLGLALEVKLSKDKARSKSIVDDINTDIVMYTNKYSFILFVIYDLGTIRDDVEFKHDLEQADGVSVIIVKH